MSQVSETWFILYDGSSVDGSGPGKYCGRTTSYDVAKTHYEKHHADPYSTAAVKAITDKGEYWIHCRDYWNRWERIIKLDGDSITNATAPHA